MNWPWSELGLPGPAGLAAVKHAYAERLKETHPEDDPEGFQRLHRAYLAARRMAARMGEAVRAEQGGSAGEKDGWDEGGGEGGEEAAKPAEPWDFEALFAQEPGGSVPPPEGREERKKGEDRTPPGEAREWDFDRLLSQGERERAEAVRRKAEERLKGTTAEGAAEGGRGRRGTRPSRPCSPWSGCGRKMPRRRTGPPFSGAAYSAARSIFRNLSPD